MAEANRPLRIFVASPGDCAAERGVVRCVATQDPSIQTLCRHMGISIHVFGWEDLSSGLGRPQSLINDAVETFDPDGFVFIFWHRFGSDAGLGMTGSEEEWRIAAQRHEEGGGHPWVSIYFNRANPPWQELNGYQFEALKKFRDDISAKHQALACDFHGTNDFGENFKAHLIDRLLKHSATQAAGRTFGPSFLRQELRTASQALLNWPATLGNNQEIERPEIEFLFQRIQDSSSSTTLILGGQGSGKSALLATLGHCVITQRIVLLAIKADMLGPTLHTPEDLRRDWLHLSIDPRDAVRTLAKNERVVLLIDQLDAVSELLDRHSGRLNVLLNMIQALSGTPNVHIVATSREFEFRHDVRLTSINAEQLTLQLPTWDQVASLLAQAGHTPDTMSGPLRELLRTPLHLKIFLDVAVSGEAFESLQALLGKLWDRHVINPEGPDNRLLLLEQLAKRMADDETLWLPTAVADGYPKARQALEQAEILTREPQGQTLGFRHQTYYDYTLARALARGSISLAEHVMQRQDGLFVRPTLLSGLHYLRATSRGQYHQQLRKLMGSSPRLHIHTLLIEVLGEQKKSDDTESSILLPLLNLPMEGPRILNAVTGSPGWFARLRHSSGLEQWMGKPPGEAVYCVPLLQSALRFGVEDVLRLLEHYWLDDPIYDALSFRVLLDLDVWSTRAVTIVTKLVRRSEWWGIEMLVEQIAASRPDDAPRVLRADLDRRLEQALNDIPSPQPPLPPGADEEQRLLHDLTDYDHQRRPLRQLLESAEAWHDIVPLAKMAPKAFLHQVWPWFLDIIQRIAEDEHPLLVRYRNDHVTDHKSDDISLPAPFIIPALYAAISTLGEHVPSDLLHFVQANASSELMIVQRLLSHGLVCVVAQEPQQVLEYLLGDPRRLILGDTWDEHRETKQLIMEVCPHLSPHDLIHLERTVLAFTPYKHMSPEWSANERRERLQWARQDRLRLLRAFPESGLSIEGKRLRAEEERAFSETSDKGVRSFGGTVGPRMVSEEMAQASDEALRRLFDVLPDTTEWHNPQRSLFDDPFRAGGAIQLSRELGKLAEQEPLRVAQLLAHFQPTQHETYVGASLESVAKTDFPTDDLVNLIVSCDNRGFSSEDFRAGAARALEARAHRDEGLPTEILTRLETWLDIHPEPIVPVDQRESRDDIDQEGVTSLFSSMTFAYPPGRGYILNAIAAGYLEKEPPDLDNWARVIASRLAHEQHPAIWGRTLMLMSMLFNGDRDRASSLYDAIIQGCPAVLRHNFALRAIAEVLGRVQPKERVQGWLDRLLVDEAGICRGAYGELLLLYQYHHQDAWSEDRIRHHLTHTTDPAALRGIAQAAAHSWRYKPSQRIATEILCALASYNEQSVQRAVAEVCHVNREEFTLNAAMRQIIEAVRSCTPVLLEAALNLVEMLEPFTGTEPELVSMLCQDVLRAGGTRLGNQAGSFALLAQPLTNIALTLHRQDAYRAAGLALFEQLLSFNVREAQYALDILDRKPTQEHHPQPRRRHRVRSS